MATCLIKNPDDRPTARDLTAHRFVKTTKKNTVLLDLIERFENYKSTHGNDLLSSDDEHGGGGGGDGDVDGFDDDDWEFETIKKATPVAKAVAAAVRDEKPTPVSATTLAAAVAVEEANAATAEVDGFGNGAEEAYGEPPSSATFAPNPTAPPLAEEFEPFPDDSVLMSVVYPAMTRLVRASKDATVRSAVAAIKAAFDTAERTKADIAAELVAEMVDVIKTHPDPEVVALLPVVEVAVASAAAAANAGSASTAGGSGSGGGGTSSEAGDQGSGDAQPSPVARYLYNRWNARTKRAI